MASQNSQHSSPRCDVIKDIRRLCSHIFEGGHRCASPALRGETRCYHHQPAHIGLPTRNVVRAAERHHRRTFPIACPTSQVELQQTLGVILQALALDRIAVRHAGRLLAALEQLSNNLPDSASPPSSTSNSASPASKSPQPASSPIGRSTQVDSQLPFVPAAGSNPGGKGRCDRRASASIPSMLHVTNHV